MLPSSRSEWNQVPSGFCKECCHCLLTRSTSEDQLFRQILMSKDSNSFDSHCLLAEATPLHPLLEQIQVQGKKKNSAVSFQQGSSKELLFLCMFLHFDLKLQIQPKEPDKSPVPFLCLRAHKIATTRLIHAHSETNCFCNCSREAISTVMIVFM